MKGDLTFKNKEDKMVSNASRKRKDKKDREKQIEDLKKELEDSSTVLKNNKENLNVQIQAGLYRRGFPQTSPMFNSLLEVMKLDIEETAITLKTDMRLSTSMYEYQKDNRWNEIQVIKQKRHLSALKDNLKEIEKQVEEVKNEIIAQNARIKERQVQIMEDLEKLGEDVKDLKKGSPNYIG